MGLGHVENISTAMWALTTQSSTAGHVQPMDPGPAVLSSIFHALALSFTEHESKQRCAHQSLWPTSACCLSS